MSLLAPEEAVYCNQELVDACRLARMNAAAAIARSHILISAVRRTTDRATRFNLDSRRHLVYARLQGVVNCSAVAAVVRRDGRISGHRPLLNRAGLVEALGETFDDGRIAASTGVDPLISTLTLVRACDQILSLELIDGPPPPIELSERPAGSKTHRAVRPHPYPDRSAG